MGFAALYPSYALWWARRFAPLPTLHLLAQVSIAHGNQRIADHRLGSVILDSRPCTDSLAHHDID
jgi:hypothetical protein